MIIGISKEDLLRYKDSAEKAGNFTAMLIIQDLIYKCKELDLREEFQEDPTYTQPNDPGRASS